MTGIGDLKRNDVEAAVAYVVTVLDDERVPDADDWQTLLMLQDDPEELSAALRDLYAKRQAQGLAAPARVVDLERIRAALGRLDRAVEQHPELTTARAGVARGVDGGAGAVGGAGTRAGGGVVSARQTRVFSWSDEAEELLDAARAAAPPSVATRGNSAVVRWALRVSVLASARARQAAAEAPAQKGGRAPRKAM
ncbi:hypothetical protein [Sorangium sp. So ce1153]|uniref:hypothetical protein n=1 Tax=Sorangium sp. So ce1153 TaxID=3133333 RepID=UPI003F5DC94B